MNQINLNNKDLSVITLALREEIKHLKKVLDIYKNATCCDDLRQKNETLSEIDYTEKLLNQIMEVKQNV